jgi:hypothetical protein
MQVTSLGKVTTSQKVVIAIDFGMTYSGTSRVDTSDPSHNADCASRRANVKEETVFLETPDEGWFFGETAVEKFKDSDLRDIRGGLARTTTPCRPRVRTTCANGASTLYRSISLLLHYCHERVPAIISIPGRGADES